MRVLHIIPSLGGGGAERQIAYLAEGLGKRGVEVHVAIMHGGPYLARVIDAGATVHYMSGSGHHDPRLLLRIRDVVRSVRPDVMQTWLTHADVLGGLTALTRRIPWILSERAAPQAYGRSWKNALRHFLGRFADAIVANSAIGLAYWTDSHARKFVIPNAVDIASIDAAPPAVVDVEESQSIVLYAGRLEAPKNLETLVPALCEIVRAKNAIVLVCGEGPDEAAMRSDAEKCGCSGRFRMLGFTDDVWRYMKRADVLVSVSWFEGHPNAVLEAATARCPLVVSDIAPHRAFLSDDSATFAPPGDAAAIARAVEAVLDDPAAAREKARRARAAVEAWSIEHVTAEYLNIYEEVFARVDAANMQLRGRRAR